MAKVWKLSPASTKMRFPDEKFLLGKNKSILKPE